MDNELGSIETEMKRGFLQLLVLIILEKDAYGYAMVRAFRDLGYEVEENTIYPLLRRLEKKGLIHGKWELSEERPRKFYAVTSARSGNARRTAAPYGRNRMRSSITLSRRINMHKNLENYLEEISHYLSGRSEERGNPVQNPQPHTGKSRAGSGAGDGSVAWKRSSLPTANRGWWPKNTLTACRSSPRPSSACSSATRHFFLPSTYFLSCSPLSSRKASSSFPSSLYPAWGSSKPSCTCPRPF